MINIAFVLLLITFLSLWLYPSATPALGIASLLFTLAVSIQSIFKKHEASENPRPKIAKDVWILVITMLLVIVLGGIVGLLAGKYAGEYIESRWQGFGMAAGFVSAILVGFAIGYAVKWGVGKLGKE
jgi:hypothetical protein